MKKCYDYNVINKERHMITVSSSATKADWEYSFTAETGGNCLGPADLDDEGVREYYAKFFSDNWDSFEEMEKEEEDERIRHLAEEWGLEEGELWHLR